MKSDFDYKKLKDINGILTLVPFDLSTEEGRSKERYRRSMLTTASTIFSKTISSAVMLYSIPLTVHYLGPERFGLWMIISSFLLFLSTFSDLGLGISYMNKVSATSGTQEFTLARVYTSNAIIILILASAILILSTLLLNPMINWQAILNIENLATSAEISGAISLLVIIFACGLPLIIVEKFLEGNQRGYVNNLWQAAANILSLGGILIVVHYQFGIKGLIIATLGIPVVMRLINFVYQFRFKYKWAMPSFHDADKTIFPDLIKPGLIFFVISVFHVIGYNSDNFIITRMLDVSSVALYGVVQKIAFLAIIFWSFTNALWPAYTEALARKDFEWIKKTIRRTFFINLILGILIGISLTVFGSWAISVWTAGVLVPSTSLLLGFSFYIIVNGLVGSFAIIYNSSFLLKWQVPLIIISSIASIPIKIWLCSHFGTSGVVWGSVMSYSLFYILPSFIIVEKYFFKRMSNV